MQNYTEGFNFSIRITFGVRGQKPLLWDGRASIDNGKIQGIRGVKFAEDDEIFPTENRWRCAIGRLRGREYAKGLGDRISIREFVQEIMSKGVELDIMATTDASITISSIAGNFSFSLADLVVGRKIDFLDGNLGIELIPRPHEIPSAGEIENYPGIITDAEGNVWLAWVSFSKGKESVVISKHTDSGWGKPELLDRGKEGYLSPVMAAMPNGDLWIVWPGREKGDWDLYARQYNRKKGKWYGTVRMTKKNGPDVNPALAADQSGRVYLCWQGFTNGNHEIFLRILDNKKWGESLNVTQNEGNDWEPALALSNGGMLLIAWESFRDGLHQIMAQKWAGGAFDSELILTSSKSAVAHASAVSDLNGRFWVSWDEAGPDWGFGEAEEERTIGVYKFDELSTQIDYDKVAIVGRRGRYNSRQLGLVCLDSKGIYRPEKGLLENLSTPMQMYADIPRLIVDPKNRLWIIFHHYVGKIPFYVHGQLMEVWKVYALYYDGLKWSDPIPMPHNTWRQFSGASICIDSAGHLWTAYTQDNRELGKRGVEPPTLSVSSFALPAGDRGSVPVIPLYNGDIQKTAMGKNRKDGLSGGSYQTSLGSTAYKLYWGSLHDIHDVRGRMNLDGFVIDAFKYALDDWGYDFTGLKDYACRDDGWFVNGNYAWWETQKAIDLFSVKNEFLSFFLRAKSPFIRPKAHGLLKKQPPKGVPIIMGVYAEDLTEKAMVEAIEKRRQYLATDKILLDFWIAGHPMGEKFKSSDRFPKMEALVVGTQKLKRVDILKNAECVYSTEPDSNEVRFTFVDMGLDPDVPGEYHYFLQAVQENGRMAWTPPACLHYFPGYD
ncbi:MAG: hypothetical protein ACMUIM_06215 [bacterium]